MTAAFHFEAKKYALRQAKDGVIVSFVVHPDDVVAELLSAPIGEHYVVALAPYTEQSPPSSTGSEQPNSTRRVGGSNPSADAIPSEEAPAPVERERRPFHTLPRSQQAGILCGTPEFRTWLAREMRATPNDEAEWVASEVRAICGVSSRTGLDHNEVAACNWDALRNRFHADTGQTTWERPS